MTIDEDVQSFTVWGTSLGYPIENMPNVNALKSIFRSRQSSLLFNLMERVRPRQQVSEIRKNILVNKMENMDPIIPFCTRNSLPLDMQRFLKIKEFTQQKIEIETRLAEAKKNSSPDILKTKNLQKIKMVNNCDELKTKLNILELKLDSLTEDCNKELKITEKIKSIMPVKSTPTNSNPSTVNKAIIECLKKLDEFYKIYLVSSHPNIIVETKEELWIKLKNIFANIPNHMIFKIIMILQEEQLVKIKNLNNNSVEERNKKLDNSIICETNLLKLKASVLLVISKYVSTNEEINNINKKFTLNYKYFTDGLQSKLNLFNNTNAGIELSNDEMDEIISDYIVQYTKLNYVKGQIIFLNAEIDRVKNYIDTNQHQLDDHQITIESLTQIYNDINVTLCRIHQDILQFSEIKDKIYYTKSLLQYMLKDTQSLHQQKTKLSVSSVSGASFNISDNLCSTKVDFDCTTISNMTLRDDNMLVGNYDGSDLLQPYYTELMIFMRIPISKLHIMSQECWTYLLPNPLIIETNGSVSTSQFCPGSLLTVHGSLKLFKSQIDWYKRIKNISNELQNDFAVVEINENDLKSKMKQQQEEITEILDKTDVIAVYTNRILQKSEKYYNFILNNPLKNYIPKSKLFNNQTYFDYDAEYAMYYRIATTGASIQE